MADRKILHLDLDAFFCAVEELRDPLLQGKPFAVGGKPNQRGVIASCSYAARQFGIHSAMPTAAAMRLCPELILISSNYSNYQAASQQVMEILGQHTALIEQISIDEAFLDVSDLPQTLYSLALQFQEEIFNQLRLPCSLGGATNKLVAKIATNQAKSTRRGPLAPKAIKIISAGEEATFLAPLPVRELWGVGPKMSARLLESGVATIGDLAAQPETWLAKNFGKWGHEMGLHARGIDDRPIQIAHSVKSISQEMTFDRDISDQQRLENILRDLSIQVGFRLRADKLTASTVRIKLRWPDFTSHTRQLTLPQPADQDGVIFETACRLFHSLWHPGRAVRLLGVGTSGLAADTYQPSLWDTPSEKERRLLHALDDLQAKFGEGAVHRGGVVKPRRRPPQG